MWFTAYNRHCTPQSVLDAERLRERADAVGISQSELARRLRMSQQNMNYLFSGEAKGTKQLHRIARELRTTPAYLTRETDDPEADAPPTPEFSHDEILWVEYWRAIPHDRRPTMVQVVQYAIGGESHSVHAPRHAYAGQPR